MSVRDEVDTELESHIAEHARELMAGGLDPEEARARALARFGDLAATRKTCRRIARSRDRRHGLVEWLGEVGQDVRFAFRQMRQSAVWTFLVIVSLAVGIGANTVVFSVANAVVLSPLPYPESERLVRIREITPEGGQFSTSEPNFLDFQQRASSIEHMAAIAMMQSQATLLGEGEPEQLPSLACTTRFFDVLGIAPRLGRTFLPNEGQPGNAAHVAVLSDGLWQRRFGGDPSIVGRKLNLNGEAWTVIGVMPPSFRFPIPSDIWFPYAPDPGGDRGDHRLESIGRLMPGVSIDQARQELNAIAAQLGEEYPESNRGWSTSMVSFREWLVGSDVEQVALVLQVAVGLMLLLACANVSNLLIARATTREHEIGIRASLGAGRARLVRQLLTESILLALAGAAAGLALSVWALPLLIAWNPDALPRLDEVSLDPKVLLFTVAVSIMTGLIAGIAPAIHVTRGNLSDCLRGGRASSRGRTRRLRDVLVVGELALAVILLIGAGLLVDSLQRLQRIDPGFVSENVLVAPVSLPANRYPEMSPQVAAFYREVLERIRAIPGVSHAAATAVNPFSGVQLSSVAGSIDATDRSEFVRMQWRSVTEEFFTAMGIPLLRGRLFDRTDRMNPSATPEERFRQPPIVISDELAERLWPGEDPIGKLVQWSAPGGPKLEVVGIAGGIRDANLASETPPMLFFNHENVVWPEMTLVIKAAIDPESLAPAVRAAIRETDPNLPAPSLVTLQSRLDQASAEPRFNSRLLALFAAIALVMASLGIYGVISYAVERRTREIGIRIALGAPSRGMVSLILRQAAVLVLIGLAVGTVGAIGVTRFLRSMLYETSPTHAGIFAAVAVTLALVGIVAGGLPALRVTRIDPAITLREE